ncbi:MAG TPA: response regulator [Terriglobales bacterium]|jgi:two-component system chemotaxis response regulator CheY
MSKTILIVDSSTVMRRIIERSLVLAGLELQQLVEASNGAEALAAIEQHHPEIVLSEIKLDQLSGLDLLRRLREDEATRTLPFIFISSQAAESQVQEALTLGAQGFIRKPFTADQVKDYIAPLFT